MMKHVHRVIKLVGIIAAVFTGTAAVNLSWNLIRCWRTLATITPETGGLRYSEQQIQHVEARSAQDFARWEADLHAAQNAMNKQYTNKNDDDQ